MKQHKEYYYKHRDKRLKQKKEYYSRPEVKEYRKEYNKKHYSLPEVKEYRKKYMDKYYLDNKDKFIDKTKKYKLIPGVKEHMKEYQKQYRQLHSKERKEYVAKNREVINARLREVRQIKRDNNPAWRARINISSRIWAAVNASKTMKHNKTPELLGCSIEYFKKYIEKQFKKGMSWKNYGIVWHIDHRIPCSWFDLTKPEEQKRCFHHSNLQPTFAKENISKNDRFANPSLHQFMGEIK